MYAGDVRPDQDIVEDFLHEYLSELHNRAEAYEAPPLTGWALQQIAYAASPTSAGPDAWEPADLKLWGPLAFEWLASLLTLIEQGRPWPATMQKAFATPMLKPESSPEDPLSYRVLSVMSAAYRLWASTRMRDMQPWIQEWMLPEMHSGGPGRGAEDGWYERALQAELAAAPGIPLTGGSTDMIKCYDSLVRQLIYTVLGRAGFPRGVLCAYMGFIDGVHYCHRLSLGVGAWHTRERSIPQGRPWSVTFLALLMRPWILRTRAVGAVPRVLADDMSLCTTGEAHFRATCSGMRITQLYVRAIGGRVSAPKSYTYSSCKDTRAALRANAWDAPPALCQHKRVGLVTAASAGSRSAATSVTLEPTSP